MPRNGAGTYTLPAGNPVVTNTTITADWGNDTMEDLGNEITNSLSREGDGGMNAPLRFIDGDINAPGIAWVAETNTGFYYAGPGEFWASVLGTNVVQFTDNGLLIPTGIDLTVQGAVSFEGALNVIGNFSVATNKFTVEAATGNTTVAGTFVASGAGTFTSASATSLAVGLTGATNPAFTVDSSTASQVAGLKVTGAATAGTVAVVVTDSGSNANLTFNAKGSGTIGIGSVSTGAVTITPATTITGVATLTAQPVLSSLTASKPVFSDASKGLVSTGTLAYDQGGTGQTTYAAGDIVYASAINTLSKLAVGSSGQVLKVAAGVPSWATDTTTGTVTSVALSAPAVFTVSGSPVTSTGTLALTYSGTALPEANGGTAQTTYTTGDFLYASGSNTLSKLAVGTTGQVLKVAAGVPSWATDTTTGTVTSVGLSAPAFLTVGGSPVTTSGTLALTYSGTAIPAVNGGTAQTTYTTGDLLYASASNTLSKLAVGTSAQVLTVTAGVPTWATSSGSGTVTSVAQSFTGGLISVSGSPITTSGTLALTVAGTSGGIPYFSAASTWASSAALTQYGVIYGGGAGASPVATANGTTGQVLTATTSGAPSWASPATSGTVTSVAVSGGTTGLTTSGGPITTSGTITLAGTLAPANGGTGVANNAASTLTISGAYATTLTVTAATGVTLPTTGTLATLAGSETLTNKTLTSPTMTAPVLGTPASGNLSSCTADGTDQVGFKNIPQNSQSAAYTLVLADAGKHIFHPSTDANARTYTIPANGSVAYPIGTALTFINMTSQVVTIAITTDTMYLSSAGTTGSRSLAIYGSATAIKMTSTTWLISGSGLT
jgi:hypothetical protein